MSRQPLALTVTDLATRLGGDDSSFTETMTGIIRTVGEKFSSSASNEKQPAPVRSALDDIESDESLFSNPKILGAAAVAVVAVIALGWWLFSGSDDSLPADSVRGQREFNCSGHQPCI